MDDRYNVLETGCVYIGDKRGLSALLEYTCEQTLDAGADLAADKPQYGGDKLPNMGGMYSS
jgi:hypothetical protein